MPFMKRFAAAMLSLAVPGAGQLYIGRTRTGLWLLLAAITATAGIVYTAGTFGGRHLVLIVYLCMSLPVIYFYSIYDILQATSAAGGGHAQSDRERVTGLQGMGLIAAGLLLLVVIQPAEWAEPMLGTAGDYAAAAGLVIIAAVMYGRRDRAMYRLGRVTAASVLVAVGCLLLWDRIEGGDKIALVGQWWPAALIALGVEVVAISFGSRRCGKSIRFDTGGLVLAVVVSVVAYGVTQLSGFPMKWIDQWTAEVSELSGFTEEKGFQYTKEPVTHQLEDTALSLVIDNPNGRVTLREMDVEQILVETVVWVDLEDKAEADRVADLSVVEISGDEKLTIAAKGEAYGAAGNRKPRMNLVVTLPRSPEPVKIEIEDEPAEPESMEPDGTESDGTNSSNSESDTAGEAANGAGQAEQVEQAEQIEQPAQSEQIEQPVQSEQIEQPVQSEENVIEQIEELLPADDQALGLHTIKISVLNGDVDVQDVRVLESLEIDNANGAIMLRSLSALSVKASTKNGGVEAYDIEGAARLATFNGRIVGERIAGDALVTTTNGSVRLQTVGGRIEADTKNGEIDILDVQGAVHADTLNGRIAVASPVIGGAWDIGSAVGEIHVALPEHGDYSVRGSVTFGDITTDLPLEVSKKTVEGEVGEGTYRISIDANSSIAIQRYQPYPPPSN